MPDLLVLSAIAFILLLPCFAMTVGSINRDILKGRYAPKRKVARPVVPYDDDDDAYFVGFHVPEGNFREFGQ